MNCDDMRAGLVVLEENMEEKWFAPHVAYTMAKFGMSMCVLGMAGEFREQGIAVNALWPRTTIATAAVQNLLGGDELARRSRKPEIMGDAAHVILTLRALGPVSGPLAFKFQSPTAQMRGPTGPSALSAHLVVLSHRDSAFTRWAVR